MMTTPPNTTLDYATPMRPSRSKRQRVLYCIGLPLLAFGWAMAHDPRDVFLAALIAAVGALMLAFALPLRSEGDGR